MSTQQKSKNEQIHELYLKARTLYEKENLFEAQKALEELSREAPFFADIYNKLGVIYHQNGAFGKASRAFEKALELNPHYTEASLNLSVTLNNLGRYDEAKDIFEKAASFAGATSEGLDPFIRGKLANEHADLAAIYNDLGLHDEAVEQYRRAVGLGPGFADLRARFAAALRDRGDYEEALAEFGESIKCNAKFIPAYVHLGMTYYMAGDIARAIETWQKALEIDPEARAVKVYLDFARSRSADS